MISLEQTRLFRKDQRRVLQRRGITTVRDLFFYLPRRYIDRSRNIDLNEVPPGEEVSFIGTVLESQIQYGKRKRLVVTVKSEKNQIEMVYFNGIEYYSKLLKPQSLVAFSGRIESFKDKLSMLHPEMEFVTNEDLIHTGRIVPLYTITGDMQRSGLTSRSIRAAIKRAFKEFGDRIKDHVNEDYLEAEDLMPLRQALEKIHFPESLDEVGKARQRLAFDELLYFSALMEEKRILRESMRKSFQFTIKAEDLKLRQQLLENLPFRLTRDQEMALKSLDEYFSTPHPGGVLLQGDVGSGKTLVALLVALRYIEEGIQVALMAPTEVLARQHFYTFRNFLKDFVFFPMDLLLGSEKAQERKAKLERLRKGETMFVVGTHALIQDDVEFSKLGLVIIDEQHRFGVEQREKLRAKGGLPDILAMTATPIPRSLTLALYGDLEQVIIREKPPGRKPVDTRIYREADLPRIYKSVEKYLSQGRQAYIVYPMIEENEKASYASLLSDFHYLEKTVFPNRRLGLLHGRLSSEEKERAMQKFKEGLIEILVTTTVVEVGVDVPNANIIIIRNAERFGLSQLHQLRGRVGRGEHQSFCILIPSNNITAEGQLRLQAMVESNDGFYLAQRDFEIRGPGEIMGVKQAGVSELRIADLRQDTELLIKARKYLKEHMELYRDITQAKNWKNELQKGMLLFAN
ncbi:MAG: ATP-dependent DNA helicase RecG [Leptospiraceae bacterium]|nr:ATP-dependent DNA helicase RecG [Leptospiraceae bacterium]MDW8307277.1 ATP-dependent DNA helicase RecG [Leptospiraceae bacterium]